MGHHFARQDSILDPGSSSTSSGSPDAGDSSTPAPSTSIGGSGSSLASTSDAGTTALSPSAIVTSNSFAATDSAATTLGTTPSNSNSNTAAVASSTLGSSVVPPSQPTDSSFSSGGASSAGSSTVTAPTSSGLSSGSQQGSSFSSSVTSNSASSASVSASISTSVTDSASASLTSSSLTPSVSGSSSFLSSPSFPSSTTTSESTPNSESSSSTTESSSSHSSTRSSTNSRSTSLTTSYTEVISTVDGQITTIFSPVATLSVETSLTTTSSNRTAIIAGVSAGCAALIILVLLGVFMYRRRQKRRGDQSHRYLPTPRSVMLSGEDDFDLAGSQQQSQMQRGIAIFGSRRTKRGGEQYGNLASESEGGVPSHSPPVMRELPSEPPPRLLRPVASKTGSYFQEAVWPPPDEGSRLSDPLMAASHVDLHGIVEEVMGPSGSGEPGPSRTDANASSSSSSPPASRLRGGAGDRSSFPSLSGDSGVFTEFAPRIPQRRKDSPSSYSMESGFGGESPLLHHVRDWSADSSTGLLAHMEGGGSSSRGTKRSSDSSSGSAWLPPGAAPPALLYGYGRPTSPPSPLRVVTEPAQNSSIVAPLQARRKADQGRRSSTRMAVVNPSLDEEGNENASTSIQAPSYSVSLSSTQRLRRPAGTLETTGEEMATPYSDESPIDRRSTAHNTWLLGVNAEDDDVPGHGQTPTKPRDEIPPRYDMIRRDSYSEEEDSLVGPNTRTTTTSS